MGSRGAPSRGATVAAAMKHVAEFGEKFRFRKLPLGTSSGRRSGYTAPRMSNSKPEASVSDRWDAGAMGCGELVLELRGRLNALAPGAVLQLNALDPGAVEDIPAWCRLTGHTLLAADHPVYYLRRKER